MIQVPADIYTALLGRVVHKRLRVTWQLRNGQSFDLTDRLVSVGNITRTINALMEGYTVSRVDVTISNHDRMLSPTAEGSLIYRQNREDFVDSSLIIEQGVRGDLSGWYYLPVYSGDVESLNYGDGLVSFGVTDRLTRLLRVQLPVEVPILPADPAGWHVRNLLTTYADLTIAGHRLGGGWRHPTGDIADGRLHHASKVWDVNPISRRGWQAAA
jgi:hypothetical protein